MISIFGNLFDSFSARPEAAAKRKHVVPERTRNRILMLCKEIFSNERSGYYAAAAGDYLPEFWEQIHRLRKFPFLEVPP